MWKLIPAVILVCLTLTSSVQAKPLTANECSMNPPDSQCLLTEALREACDPLNQNCSVKCIVPGDVSLSPLEVDRYGSYVLVADGVMNQMGVIMFTRMKYILDPDSCE